MPDPDFLAWGFSRSLPPRPAVGGPGGSPRLRKGPSHFRPRSPPYVSLSRSRSLSLSYSLLLLPFPWLLFSRTLLTRQADPPYPAGGPSLPGRRALLTRQADPPYPTGGPSLPGRRQAGASAWSFCRRGELEAEYKGLRAPTPPGVWCSCVPGPPSSPCGVRCFPLFLFFPLEPAEVGSFTAVPCLVSAVGRLLSVVLPPHTSRDAGTLPASRTRAAHLYTGGGALATPW